MKETRFEKIKRLLPLLAFLPIILVVFALVINASEMPSKAVYGENGVWDMRGFDFAYNARLDGYFEFIPALLTPSEFAARADEAALGDLRGELYHTSRMVIIVPTDGWYTFTCRSMRASHRLYVNGEFMNEIGRPGYCRDTEIPQIGHLTFTARAEGGIIEIVQQSSNHVHSRADKHAWVMGTGGAPSGESRNTDIRQSVLMGSFLIMFAISLLFYCFLQGNRGLLYTALLSLAWFFRMGYIQGSVFTVLMPWLSWEAQFRLEYIGIAASAALVPAIIASLFPEMLHKFVLRAVYAIVAGFVALYLFADTVLMSRAIIVSYVFFVMIAVYVLIRMVMHIRKVYVEQVVFIIGMAVFILAIPLDIFYLTLGGGFPLITSPIQVSGIAMLIFTLCLAAAVFINTMREVKAAKEAEKRFAVENAALESLSRMKSDYLANMSHETKTPLTVISVYVQLAAELYEESGMTDAEIRESLARAQEEIMRLSRMNDSTLRLAAMQTMGERVSHVDTVEWLKNSTEAYRNIIEKRENEFTVNIPENLPAITGNADRLIQVIANLLINANKHTKNGRINVDAYMDGNEIMVAVKDSGTGIPADILANVFERGVSGSGGTGFGMDICKVTVEAHGGKIWVESEQGVGTSVMFTLPVKER